MIGAAIKEAIAGVADPVTGIIDAKERTKRVLAIGRAYAQVASATWRPWLAKATGWAMVAYVGGTFALTAAVLAGIALDGEWAALSDDGSDLYYLLEFWKELGKHIFGFAALFLTTYAGMRGIEKAAASFGGKAGKFVGGIAGAVTGAEVSRQSVQVSDAPIDRIPGVVHRRSEVPLVDMEKLRNELKRDEGYRLEIYVDTEGHKTAGIGHKLVPNDPEYLHPVGFEISHARAIQWFESDMVGAISDVKKLFPKFKTMPFDLRHVLINLMFNLGYTRLKQFTKTRAFIDAGQWDMAATELLDSKYAKQVGPRADRLSARIAALSAGPHIALS